MDNSDDSSDSSKFNIKGPRAGDKRRRRNREVLKKRVIPGLSNILTCVPDTVGVSVKDEEILPLNESDVSYGQRAFIPDTVLGGCNPMKVYAGENYQADQEVLETAFSDPRSDSSFVGADLKKIGVIDSPEDLAKQPGPDYNPVHERAVLKILEAEA